MRLLEGPGLDLQALPPPERGRLHSNPVDVQTKSVLWRPLACVERSGKVRAGNPTGVVVNCQARGAIIERDTDLALEVLPIRSLQPFTFLEVAADGVVDELAEGVPRRERETSKHPKHGGVWADVD